MSVIGLYCKHRRIFGYIISCVGLDYIVNVAGLVNMGRSSINFLDTYFHFYHQYCLFFTFLNQLFFPDITAKCTAVMLILKQN